MKIGAREVKFEYVLCPKILINRNIIPAHSELFCLIPY